jgi:excisionase family DNA binding protein
MDAEFLTIKEVAVIFSCHPNTIRRAVKLGHIIGLRLGTGKRSPYRISKQSIQSIHTSIIRELASKYKKD